MSVILLAVGSIIAGLGIYYMKAGVKYDYLIDPLDSELFPMKFLYDIGFCVQEYRPFRLRGKIGSNLRNDAVLFFGKQYGEYYARAIWAQIISFVWLSLAVAFVLGGVFKQMSAFCAFVGIVLAAASVYYFGSFFANKLKVRREECEAELPNAISKLALLVNSGATLHDAWRLVAAGKDGALYTLMLSACEKMDNGVSEIEAIYDFGAVSDSANVKKFASALIQSIERSGAELPSFLANQSSELWAQHRQYLLQKGEKAASALLMPIAMMFLGVMLIIIAAAMSSFSV